MKFLLWMLLVWQVASPLTNAGSRPLFPLMRRISTNRIGTSCASLDAKIFAHASPSLRDLRLFTPTTEVPYTIILSEPDEVTSEAATILNLRPIAKGVALDLEMPHRPYTEVVLDIAGRDFFWNAVVSGANDLATRSRTPLGAFTLFDLASHRLSRSTTLPLQESTFRYLHIEISGPHISPAAIRAADVPPSREAQTIYIPVAQTSDVSQQGPESVVTFHIPAHVPIERVTIDTGPSGNFLRAVRVIGRTDTPGSPVETMTGNITRVHLPGINLDRRSFSAAMGINLQTDATIQVAIQNGQQRPLPITAVHIDMRQRSICFNDSGAPVTLLYGDPNLLGPHDPGVNLQPLQAAFSATLGPEIPNPEFQGTGVRDTVSIAERDAPTPSTSQPDRFWFLLLLGLGIGGTLALHVLRRR